MLKKIFLYSALIIGVTGCAGCASNGSDLAPPLVSQTVTLNAPIYFQQFRRGEQTRFIEIVSVTVQSRKKIAAQQGTVWMPVITDIGIFKKSTTWLRLEDIAFMSGPKNGRKSRGTIPRPLVDYIMLSTKQQQAAGNKTYTEYAEPRLLVCGPGVVPSEGKEAGCMKIEEFRGNEFRIRTDYKTDREYASTARDFLSLFDTDSTSSVTASDFSKRRSDVAAQIAAETASEIVNRENEVRRAKLQHETREKNFSSAKRGTVASCTTGDVIRPTTEPIAEMWFDCRQLGNRSFSALMQTGWKLTHTERIPAASWTGHQGVTVNIMLEKK